MKISCFIDTLGPGGAEGVLARLAQRWALEDHEVEIVTLSDVASDFQRPAQVKRRSIGLLGPASNTFDAIVLNVRRMARIRRYLGHERPDRVVSFIDRMNLLVLIATLGRRHEILISERSNPDLQPPHRTVHLLRSLLYRRARLLVLQSEDLAAWGSGLMGRERVRVIPNLMPEQLWNSGVSEGTSTTVVAAGRLEPQKGFDLLVRAFGRVAPRHGAWSLVIYGRGDDRESLEAQVADLGLEDRVVLPGLYVDRTAALGEAGIFVLSSRWEGMPNVLIEAMALGRCCVAFDCPNGPAEIFEHGRHGELVPAGDVEALAVALDRLMSDPERRADLGRRAYERSLAYHPSVVGPMWDEAVLSPG